MQQVEIRRYSYSPLNSSTLLEVVVTIGLAASTAIAYLGPAQTPSREKPMWSSAIMDLPSELQVESYCSYGVP